MQEMDKTRSAAVVEFEKQNSQFANSKAEFERQIAQLKSELSMCKSQLKDLGNSKHISSHGSLFLMFMCFVQFGKFIYWAKARLRNWAILRHQQDNFA